MSNQTITRAEVTDKIVSEVGLTRQESSDLLDRTLDMIGAALEHEDEVKLSRFGNFVVPEIMSLLHFAAAKMPLLLMIGLLWDFPDHNLFKLSDVRIVGEK